MEGVEAYQHDHMQRPPTVAQSNPEAVRRVAQAKPVAREHAVLAPATALSQLAAAQALHMSHLVISGFVRPRRHPSADVQVVHFSQLTKATTV